MKSGTKRSLASRSRVMAKKAAYAIASGQAKSQGEAMQLAGYSASVIQARPTKTMDAIRAEMRELLEKAMPLGELAEHIKNGLNSKKPVVVMVGNGMSEVQMVDDPHANVKYAQLILQTLGLLTRHEEVKVTHGIDRAALIAARRRVEIDPDVTDCYTIQAATVQSNDLRDIPLGHQPNGDDEGDEKAKPTDRSVGGNH